VLSLRRNILKIVLKKSLVKQKLYFTCSKLEKLYFSDKLVKYFEDRNKSIYIKAF
jgi:hypothetical protein